MFSIFGLLYLALSLAAPASSPTSNGSSHKVAAAATAPTNCYCQSMPGKDWGH